MQLTCPNCETPFSVPDNALGPDGRSVQCSRCNHVWHARAEDSLATALPVDDHPPTQTSAHDNGETYADSPPSQTTDSDVAVEPTPEPADQTPPAWDRVPPVVPHLRPEPKRRGWTRVVICLLLLLVVAATYVLRNDIADRFPQSKSLYALAGIPLRQAGEGLEFVDLQSGAAADKENTLRVSGFIQNRSDLRRPLSPIRIMVIDADKNTLADIVREGPVAEIEPRDIVRFSYDLAAPTPTMEGLKVELRFTR